MKRLSQIIIACMIGIFVQADLLRSESSIPSDDGIIYGCYKNHKNNNERQGHLRLVSDPAHCKPNESIVTWNADEFGFSEALCNLEHRIKAAVSNFEVREDCMPPVPDAPVLTELVLQTDGNTAKMIVSGTATPNTYLIPYVGDDCQELLSEFLSNLGVTGDFEVFIGPDPNFVVEIPLPPQTIPFIPFIEQLAQLWTAKSKDTLGQLSDCSPEAINLVVDSI